MAMHDTDFGIRRDDTTANHGDLSIALEYVDIDLPLLKFRLRSPKIKEHPFLVFFLAAFGARACVWISISFKYHSSLTNCPCFQTILPFVASTNYFHPL